MRKILYLIVAVLMFYACAEELIEKPDNLIPEDKMVTIIKDMAIVNAGKATNLGKLRENGIDPTSYIFKKYEIDSAQFVNSDRYYASKPLVYENMYKQVETELEDHRLKLEAEKKIRDSISQAAKVKKAVELKEKDSTSLKNVQQ